MGLLRVRVQHNTSTLSAASQVIKSEKARLSTIKNTYVALRAFRSRTPSLSTFSFLGHLPFIFT